MFYAAFTLFTRVAFALAVAAWFAGATARGASLDEAIAGALKPISLPATYETTWEQQKAVDELRDWPPVTEADEARIAAALLQLLDAPEPSLQNATASALGRRNHREVIPKLFSTLETKPDQLRTYFSSLPDCEMDPPLDLLRRGLRSDNPAAREAVIEIIQKSKAVALRKELETAAVGDPRLSVRARAAAALAALGQRESLPALRKALRGNASVLQIVARAIMQLGGDAEVDALLPLLASPDEALRVTVVTGLGEMQFKEPGPVAEALLPLLADKSREAKLAAMKSLGSLKESRAVPEIRKMFKGKDALRSEERNDAIEALKSIGDESAVTLLNEMVFDDPHLIEALVELGYASSGYALWDAYLAESIRPNPGRNSGTLGNETALYALPALADAEIFRAIRLRLNAGTNDLEKLSLKTVAEKLAARMPEVAAEPLATLRTSAPVRASDRDRDGVPDRLDKYPDDERRSEDIPFARNEISGNFPSKFYATTVLAREGPGANNVMQIAIDNDNRAGWISKVNDATPPDYYVVSNYGMNNDEWPLPNPGSTPGIVNLIPKSVNASGTVVGMAWRTKRYIPLRQDIHEPHMTCQSGFIFEKGILRFDPPPPFAGDAPNVAYKLITNGGLIFGQREERVREGDREEFRKFAFLGDHVFRDVPAFETTSLTEAGQLLGYRVVKETLINSALKTK